MELSDLLGVQALRRPVATYSVGPVLETPLVLDTILQNDLYLNQS
jgi:hypothetical protein